MLGCLPVEGNRCFVLEATRRTEVRCKEGLPDSEKGPMESSLEIFEKHLALQEGAFLQAGLRIDDHSRDLLSAACP